MRQIGLVESSSDLARLSDYLLTLGIEVQPEQVAEGYRLWIPEEDRVEEARRVFEEYRGAPEDPRYAAAAGPARALRAAQSQRQRERERVQRRVQTSQRVRGAPPLVTVTLIALSVVAAWQTKLGNPGATSLPRGANEVQALRGPLDLPIQGLTITRYVYGQGELCFFPLFSRRSEVARGEVWRLITPIFLHFSLMHILFNMLSLSSFGNLLEKKFGSGWFLAVVLTSALASNLTQYLWAGAPNFGGMSGVVYALFGYTWARGHTDPWAGFRLPANSVFTMLLWLVVCMTGTVGPIANAAHVGGLVMGGLWGLIPWLRRRILGHW